MHLPKATAKRVFEELLEHASTRTPHVMLVDSETVTMLSSIATTNDLVHRGVPVVEPIDVTFRQTLPLPAIYFVRPTATSIALIVKDFTSKPIRYKAAHIYTTSPLPDSLLNELAPIEPYVKTLKDVRFEYIPTDSRSLILLTPPVEPYALGDRERLAMARQLATFMPSAAIRHSLSDEAKKMAQAYAQVAGAGSGRTGPKDLIVFLDRSLDTVAPLLHEFTYEAMAMDLLFSASHKRGESPALFEFDVQNARGDTESKKALLSEGADPLWASLKHAHIAEVIEKVQAQLPKQGVDVSADNLAATLKKMPEYTAKLNACSTHLTLAAKLMDAFNTRQLDAVAAQEQAMACGDAAAQKRLANDVLALLDNPRVAHQDKLRLAMIFIICVGGVKEAQRKALFSAAELTAEEQVAVRNLQFFGVQVAIARGVSKAIQRQQSRFASKKKGKGDEDQVPFELSRYVPILKDVVVASMRGQLPDSEYPYMGSKEAKSSYVPSSRGGASSAMAAGGDEDEGGRGGGSSLRSTGPRWGRRKQQEGDDSGKSASASAKKEEEEDVWDERRPKLVFYVTGGITYSELRALHEAAAEFKEKCPWDVCVASERLWTPSVYLKALETMDGTGGASKMVEQTTLTGKPVKTKDADAFSLDMDD